MTKSHSRPHCPNENPFSESQFKTLKYVPGFPERFGSQEHARQFCHRFFLWYNGERRHSGFGYHTLADVHHGRAALVREARGEVLTAAYAAHPERFVRKAPEPPALPSPAWINKPVEGGCRPSDSSLGVSKGLTKFPTRSRPPQAAIDGPTAHRCA